MIASNWVSNRSVEIENTEHKKRFYFYYQNNVWTVLTKKHVM